MKLGWSESIAAMKNVQNPYKIFNILFAFYFFVLNLKLLLGFEYIFSTQSVPKEWMQGFYDSQLLLAIFNLSDTFFGFLIIFSLIVSAAIAFTKRTRLLMFLAWLAMTLVFIRIPAHKSVHIEYLGWLMIINLFIDDETRFQNQNFPKEVSWAVWIFFTLSYLLSGLAKLQIAEWMNGHALYYVLQTDVARHSLLSSFFLGHESLSKIPNYFVLLVELSGILFIWNTRTRLFYLFLSALLHLFIMIFLKISDLSIGILLFHVFLALTFYRSTEVSHA